MAFAAPITVKVALILLVVGLIVFIIGFAAPYWSDMEYETSIAVYPGNRLVNMGRARESGRMARVHIHNYKGLWKGCHEYDYISPYNRQKIDRDTCINLVDTHSGDRQKATQFFECFALIASVISFIVFLIWTVVDSCKDRRIIPILAAVLALLAGGCAFLGAIIYGTEDGIADTLDWAFALAIVGGCFFALAGIIGLVGVFMNK